MDGCLFLCNAGLTALDKLCMFVSALYCGDLLINILVKREVWYD